MEATWSVREGLIYSSDRQLKDLIEALKKADDTSRIPNSSVPGAVDHILIKSDFTEFTKIMTRIAMNCVRCHRGIARPALDAERERLRESEQKRLERIGKDRLQMNMTLTERMASEINYQREEECLRKSIENAIACLDLRELVVRELQNILSEPTELMGEFGEESDYENAIKQVEKENANDIRTQQRRLWKQTYLLAYDPAAGEEDWSSSQIIRSEN